MFSKGAPPSTQPGCVGNTSTFRCSFEPASAISLISF